MTKKILIFKSSKLEEDDYLIEHLNKFGKGKYSCEMSYYDKLEMFFPNKGKDNVKVLFNSKKLESFDFIYKAHFENGLIEHEYDHVFFGTFDGVPVINPQEANDYKWIKPSVLMEDMRSTPEVYTVWFRIIMEKMEERFPELFA